MCDPVIEAAIQAHTPDMSIRSLPYRFLQASGLTHKTIQQICAEPGGVGRCTPSMTTNAGNREAT